MAKKTVDEHLAAPEYSGIGGQDWEALRQLFGFLTREVHGGEQDNPLQTFEIWYETLDKRQRRLVQSWTEGKLPQIRTASQPTIGDPHLVSHGDNDLQTEYWDAIYERVTGPHH